MIRLTVSIEIRSDAAVDFMALIWRHRELSRLEHGCRQFDVEFRGPCRFTLHEEWADKAALDVHRHTEHYKVWRARIAGMETHHERLERKVLTVFTNGCFDVLHAGHVRLLREAKAQGDILVVGLNSDNSVRNLKGCGRPINDQQARKTVLSAIAGVDRIVIFEDETELADVICKLRPDVLVKGADWRNGTITGAEYAGRLHFVERHGTSTTATIERILTCAN